MRDRIRVNGKLYEAAESKKNMGDRIRVNGVLYESINDGSSMADRLDVSFDEKAQKEVGRAMERKLKGLKGPLHIPESEADGWSVTRVGKSKTRLIELSRYGDSHIDVVVPFTVTLDGYDTSANLDMVIEVTAMRTDNDKDYIAVEARVEQKNEPLEYAYPLGPDEDRIVEATKRYISEEFEEIVQDTVEDGIYDIF